MPEGGEGGELDAAKRRPNFTAEEVDRVPCHGSAQEGMPCHIKPLVFPLPPPPLTVTDTSRHLVVRVRVGTTWLSVTRDVSGARQEGGSERFARKSSECHSSNTSNDCDKGVAGVVIVESRAGSASVGCARSADACAAPPKRSR